MAAPDLASQVGAKSKTYREPVSRDWIARFARVAGFEPSDVAPPTFVTAFRQGEFELMQKLGIPLPKVLHGEQEYEYLAPLRGDSEVEYEVTFAAVTEKKGMHFCEFTTWIDSWSGGKRERVALAKSTIVVLGLNS